MKVLVIQGGLTDYFRLLLERLSITENLKIGLVFPVGAGATLGAGVHTDNRPVSFPVFRLQEYKAWYGKFFFKNFEQTVEEFNPDLILCGYPYMIHFALNPGLTRRLKARAINFVYRDIPWNIPPYGKAVSYFKTNPTLTEDGVAKTGLVNLIRFLVITTIRKRYLRLADAHLYYTEEATELIGSYGVPKERIFISANSPDTDFLLSIYDQLMRTDFNKPKAHLLIHVGRLVRWKRVDLIIEAICLLKDKYADIELLIIGGGPERANLERQANELGLATRITFLGAIYDWKVLGRHLLQASIYVLAGMGGLSINDAMCFGKPVICSKADGTEKRLVREGENGLYFKNGSSDDLARKIKFLFDDEQRLRRYGERSLQIIREEINIHTVLAQYVSAFNYAYASR